MPYSMDMSQEKEIKQRKLLPEGPRAFKIIEAMEQDSKSGNKMIVFTFEDNLTKYEDTIYAVAEKGKRWFLKAILDACGIKPDASGVYTWDIPDVKGRDVLGIVEHEDNTFFDRSGKEVTQKQHRITKVKPFTLNPNGVSNPKDMEWPE